MKPYRRMRPLLGTYVELGGIEPDGALLDPGDAEPETATEGVAATANLEPAINAGFARIELIQQLLSFHDPNSDLSRLNRAQGEWVDCHPLSIRCLRLARAMTRASKGHFNFTLGYAAVAQGALPAQDFAAIYGTTLLPCGSWDDLDICGLRARLRRPLLLTLDGIAKGFAVDEAALQMRRAGVTSGWVNAGGDIYTFGELVLPIAVRDHLGMDHSLGGLHKAALASSTSSASREHPGLLLDAKGNSLVPATYSVLASRAWRADALTKVAASLGNLDPAERSRILERLGGRLVFTTN
jgi:FAD:protein FMN transferase